MFTREPACLKCAIVLFTLILFIIIIKMHTFVLILIFILNYFGVFHRFQKCVSSSVSFNGNNNTHKTITNNDIKNILVYISYPDIVLSTICIYGKGKSSYLCIKVLNLTSLYFCSTIEDGIVA